MTDTSDEIFMRAALEEARKGRYIAPPNPAVGCVIVKDGQIVSRGYTHAPGSQHAEIDAIMNAKQIHHDWNADCYYEDVHTAPGRKASDCLKCGKCEKVCPQHLPIRKLLEQVAAEFEKAPAAN